MAVAQCRQCGSPAPDSGQYCSHCGSQLTGDQHRHEASQGAPGANRLSVHQTSTEYHLEASFTDSAVQHLGDLIQVLATGRMLKAPHLRGPSVETDHLDATSAVDAAGVGTDVYTPSQASSQLPGATPADAMSSIFASHGEEVRLIAPNLDLKANSEADYATRLTRVFLLYSMRHRGVDGVPTVDIYKLLDKVGLKKTSYQPAISKDRQIQRSGTILSLTQVSEQEAESNVSEILDRTIIGKWLPGKPNRPSANRVRRSVRRTTASGESGSAAESVPNNELSSLQQAVQRRHDEIVKWQIGDLCLLGLYGIRKAHGPDHGASYRQVAQFLLDVFELQVAERSLRRALETAGGSGDQVNRIKNKGYRINPTGCKHVEDLLALRQPVLVMASDEAAEETNP